VGILEPKQRALICVDIVASHTVARLRADLAGLALTKGAIERLSVVRLQSGDGRMSAGNWWRAIEISIGHLTHEIDVGGDRGGTKPSEHLGLMRDHPYSTTPGSP
jgi:hypothetical protein